MRTVANDLDYLAACLHGRRSKLAEAEQLERLCRLRSIPELATALYPGSDFRTAVDLQRRLLQDLMDEITGILEHLTGAAARLIDWILTRFQVENVKVLIRGFVSRTSLETIQPHLMSLPEHLKLDDGALVGAESMDVFIDCLPQGPLTESMKEAMGIFQVHPKPFFLEAALDRGYLRELLLRMKPVFAESKSLLEALILQEVDIFHLRLILRGRFVYGLRAESLLSFHIGGTQIPNKLFAALVAVADLDAVARHLVGRVVDELPMESLEAMETSAMLEMLAWKRFLRLANQAFRRNHIGLGVVLGYIGIRRIEVANLITLSEGIRSRMTEETIRSRLIPRSKFEGIHV